MSAHSLFYWTYDTIRYDSVYLTCSKKLTGSQLSLPHRTNNKLKRETKNKPMSVIGEMLPCVCISVCMAGCLSLCVCISVCMVGCLSLCVCISVCMAGCLSLCVCIGVCMAGSVSLCKFVLILSSDTSLNI